MVRMRNSRTGVVVDVSARRASVMRDVWVRVDQAETSNDPEPRHVRAPAIAASTDDEVLAWVDGDPDRAAQAKEAEGQHPDGPRSTLMEKLDDITG